jgi:hypothetical protein
MKRLLPILSVVTWAIASHPRNPVDSGSKLSPCLRAHAVSYVSRLHAAASKAPCSRFVMYKGRFVMCVLFICVAGCR